MDGWASPLVTGLSLAPCNLSRWTLSVPGEHITTAIVLASWETQQVQLAMGPPGTNIRGLLCVGISYY